MDENVRLTDTDSIYSGIYNVFRDRADFVHSSSFTDMVKAEVARNSGLRSELEAELSRLSGVDDDRCYISMIRKKFLRKVLHGE